MISQEYASFLKLDLSEHTGKWVAICDEKIVSIGENIKDVYSEAKKKCPNKKPLITKVPEEGAMIF